MPRDAVARTACEAKETKEVNAIEDNWKIIREATYSETLVGSPDDDFDARTALAEDHDLTDEQIDTFMAAKEEARVLADKARDLAFDAAMSLLESTLVLSDLAKEFGMIRGPMNGLPDDTPEELKKLLAALVQVKDPIAQTLAHNLSAVEKMMASATGYALHMHQGKCDDCDVRRCPVKKILRRGIRIPIE